MTPSHKDRVAVVTGAAQGFGQAICRGLAERGAQVVAIDITEPTETLALIEQAGQKATGLLVDVADPEQTQQVEHEVRGRYGRCDILINNVGVYPSIHTDDMTYDAWRKVLTINLDSQFLMTQAVLPLMKEAGWGRIVNLTSNSIGMTPPGMTAYFASKMGVIGFTRGLANDLARYGITANAVGATLSRTPGVEAGPSSFALEQVAAMQAIKKIGEPDDVVGTILFLTSHDSYFVTGQTIMADGGLMRL